jgi:hypothetical protein
MLHTICQLTVSAQHLCLLQLAGFILLATVDQQTFTSRSTILHAYDRLTRDTRTTNSEMELSSKTMSSECRIQYL